jgi:lysozyme family protein
MIDNFSECDAFTAPAEGGLSVDPTDPGNWTGGKVNDGQLLGTKYGIACADHPGVDIANLTPDAAAAIRKAGYWTPNSCDEFAPGVDLMVYDEDVNTGDGRSAKILQGCAGVVQDGAIGTVTLTAVAALDPVMLINALAKAQGAFYQSLAPFAVDGKGWMARLALRHSTALTMTRQPQAVVIPPVAPSAGAKLLNLLFG